LSETEFQIWVKSREKPGAGSVLLVEQGLVLKQGFKHGSDIGVGRDAWLPVRARA